MDAIPYIQVVWWNRLVPAPEIWHIQTTSTWKQETS